MNIQACSGFIGKDAQIKTFDNGNEVISFSVASNESYKDNEGNWKTITDWINVKLFGKNLSNFCNHLTKGKVVECFGKNKTDEYDGKYYTYLKAREVKFAPSKKDTGSTENDPLLQQDSDNLPF